MLHVLENNHMRQTMKNQSVFFFECSSSNTRDNKVSCSFSPSCPALLIINTDFLLSRTSEAEVWFLSGPPQRLVGSCGRIHTALISVSLSCLCIPLETSLLQPQLTRRSSNLGNQIGRLHLQRRAQEVALGGTGHL